MIHLIVNNKKYLVNANLTTIFQEPIRIISKFPFQKSRVKSWSLEITSDINSEESFTYSDKFQIEINGVIASINPVGITYGNSRTNIPLHSLSFKGIGKCPWKSEL